ncbi:hypothetical protein BGX29_011125 [Mortierella sp. GBA35]|nr:hypothetical protein BGX29_011125 [Mortierella sp. GBA35]
MPCESTTNDSSFHPAASTATTTTALALETTKGDNAESDHLDHNSNNKQKQGPLLLNDISDSIVCPTNKTETVEDMNDCDCSTSTGFDHDEEELREDEVEHRYQHLCQDFSLHDRHHYSDDDDEEDDDDDDDEEDVDDDDDEEDEGEEDEEDEGEVTLTVEDVLHALVHRHRDSPAEEDQEEAQAFIAASVTSSSAGLVDIDVNDNMSSSSSHSVYSVYSEESSGEDGSKSRSSSSIQHRDDLSTPPLPPSTQSQQHITQAGGSSSSATSASQPTNASSTTTSTTATTPRGLNSKSPSRLAIPRSIHFRTSTPTDRSGSAFGRLQVHTVNRLEVENSFLLNQNNSLARDIHHCRQTVQALKQILAQREDTIGRMKQEAHQAHLKITFMESLLSGQQHRHPLLGRHLQMQQQQGGQQEQQRGPEGDWKERHRLDDDEEEEEGGVEGEPSSILDMFAQDEPPFDWLLKGWGEGEMPVAEDSDIDRASVEDEEDEDEEEEEREIQRQVRSIFSGAKDDDEQYHSDEYTDEEYEDEDEDEDEEDDEEEDEDEEEEEEDGDRVGKRSGPSDFEHRMMGSRVYQQQQQHTGESSALSLSMSLSNNSICILAQECNDDKPSVADDNNDDERAFICDNQPPSPVSLPSPALSGSSMSLESPSEGSNGSLANLSCSSLSSINTSNTSTGEKNVFGSQEQGAIEAPSGTVVDNNDDCGTNQQGLQLPAVVPYSSFRDSGHFPTQVFTMDYEEQHLSLHDKDVQDDDQDSQESLPPVSPLLPTTTTHDFDKDPMMSSSSSSSGTKKGQSMANLRSGVHAVLIQAEDISQHAPLCQPSGHPCLGASPPTAALASISRVHIETGASSTTLVSASSPSPTGDLAPGKSLGRDRAFSLVEAVDEVELGCDSDGGSGSAGGSSGVVQQPMVDLREESLSVEKSSISLSTTLGSEESLLTNGTADTELSSQGDVTADDSAKESTVTQSASVGSMPDTGTNSTWTPSSLFKGWLPFRLKRPQSMRFKDRVSVRYSRDLATEGGGGAGESKTKMGGNGDDGGVVKEQSVASNMLKTKTPSALAVTTTVTTAGAGGSSGGRQKPVVSGPTSPSTVFSRVFSGRGSRVKV